MAIDVIRPGRWVVHKGVVGILHATSGPRGEFHRTGAIGETVAAYHVPLLELRQARADEIPPARRPDVCTLLELGYDCTTLVEQEAAQ